MKIRKKTIIKFSLIGTFHATVFLWLIPFVIVPRFDEITSGLAVSCIAILTVVITLIILFYPVHRGRRTSKDEGEK